MPTKDPARRRLLQREWKRRNRDRVNARRRLLYSKNPEKNRRKVRLYRRKNAAKVNAYNAAWSRRYRRSLRDEMFRVYGNRCACCKETEPLFLQLDHINNDGAKDRREHRTGAKMLAAAKRQGWPKGRYQVLCANCNHGKRMNNGVCPHRS